MQNFTVLDEMFRNRNDEIIESVLDNVTVLKLQLPFLGILPES